MTFRCSPPRGSHLRGPLRRNTMQQSWCIPETHSRKDLKKEIWNLKMDYFWKTFLSKAIISIHFLFPVVQFQGCFHGMWQAAELQMQDDAVRVSQETDEQWKKQTSLGQIGDAKICEILPAFSINQFCSLCEITRWNRNPALDQAGVDGFFTSGRMGK